MKPKIPLVTQSLKKRLWSIIIIVMGYLVYTSLGNLIPQYWEMIGLKSFNRAVLTLGGIVILLICLSGLAISEKLSHIVIREELTGLYNRSYIRQRLQEELYRSGRYGHPLSVLMIDVDGFKAINDKYGHTAGDRVLKFFAHLIKQEIRQSDIPARYGGEEFLIMMPETSSQDAFCAAERLRKKVSSYRFKVDSHKDEVIHFTVSIGICSYPQYGRNPNEIISLADTAMYQAKKKGKDKAAVYREEMSSKSRVPLVN
ncbi:MAG: GGDEF domain-containing protein [Candidatus Aminicenantes bacterium]